MEHLIDLSRLQFALTAMYHFIFVPLTLGLVWILVIMESCYVATGKEIYRDMTKFWGKLFGINFAIGVTTGLTLEFQFGTNWAYYSHYVGDIFGTPLAIEGLMAFFLESTFVGLFFLGWNKLSKKQHLLSTILVAFGSNMSALWILIANGWMQNPVGTTFNPVTMRMELASFYDVAFNMAAQAKFLHTVSAGYMTGAIFVLSISAYYMLKKRDIPFAKRSFKIAAWYGLLMSIMLIAMGDRSGLYVYHDQPSKLAAIEGLWDTPTGDQTPWSLFVIPNEKDRKNDLDIAIPYAGSLILTHSLHGKVTGINDIIEQNKAKIKSGQQTLAFLDFYRKDTYEHAFILPFIQSGQANLGYGLLLKKYTDNMDDVTPAMIDKAARDTVPQVLPLFYTFRLMVALGVSFFLLFLFGVYYSGKEGLENRRKLLKFAFYWLPAPWIACWCGWFVAEYGRQPWTIFGILPTYQSASSLTSGQLVFSLTGFIVLYTVLLIIEMFLMTKYIKLGPSSLGTKKYHFEK